MIFSGMLLKFAPYAMIAAGVVGFWYYSMNQSAKLALETAKAQQIELIMKAQQDRYAVIAAQNELLIVEVDVC